MKTKIIPFDLETAKKIQAGEIEGKIIMKSGNEVRIICFDRENIFPIVALAREEENYEGVYFYNKFGAYEFRDMAKRDLVLEVADNNPQFKPFDKVLCRDRDDDVWSANLFSHEECGEPYPYFVCGDRYKKCIPYEGNEHLVGTTDKPKED